MSRRLLTGRAGSGKTHTCLERLAEAVSAGRRALLLVPTYGQAEHLRYRLLDRIAGVKEGCLETFSSLAERVCGLRLSDGVPGAVCDGIAEKILVEHFPHAAARPGFRAEFLASVKEIKENGADSEEILERVRTHFPSGSRQRCLFESYALYLEALPGLDHEDLLRRARDRLVDSPEPLDLLLVDGFHDFTGLERQMVKALSEAAAETLVTLPLDPDNPACKTFATASRTAGEFVDYQKEALRGNRRALGALAELEREMFEPAETPRAIDSVEVLACPSEADEADRVARLVVRANRPFSEFLVVRRSFEGLCETYRAAFRRHGVPIRFFGRESLGRTPAAQAVTIWLRAMTGEVPPIELFPLLRSPYFLAAPQSGEVDRLARHLREKGELELDETFPLLRTTLARPENDLSQALAHRFGLRDALVGTPDGDDELARAARFLALLKEEADAVSDRPFQVAAERVLHRIPLLRGAPPDRRHNCVYAVEALDARQWEKPVVIVTGLSSDSFPRQIRQDLFVRDDERRALREERGLHLPLRSLKEDEERYLFYVALTRARERIVLTYPAFDEEGTPRAPSPYLEEIVARFGPKKREIPLSELYAHPEDAVARADLLPIVTDGLARAHLDEGGIAAALHEQDAALRELVAWPRRLELARARPIEHFPVDPGARLSATAINDYLRCPYLFFTRRVLRVSPERAHVLNPLTRGGIVHEVLERVSRDGVDPGEAFDEIFEERARGFRVGLAEEVERRWMRGAVIATAERLAGEPLEEPEHPFKLMVGDVLLRGKIDRIDAYPEGRVIRDYKTGALDLEHSVQLDAYLLAVSNPAGAVFEDLRKGRSVGFVRQELAGAFPGKHVEKVSAAEIDRRRADMRTLVETVAAAARDGRLALSPRDPESCTRGKCDGYDLCRVARGRWLAKKARAE